MKASLIVLPEGDRLRRWLQGGEAGAEATGTDIVLAVPAQHALLWEVSVDDAERRLLRRTIPYRLEEALLDDVEAQHFAFGELRGETVPVAVVAREWLAGCIERAAAEGFEVRRAVPEQLLLPWREGGWTLLAEPGRWVLRLGRWRGLALEPEAAALALQLAMDEADSLPRQLTLYTDLDPRPLLAQLPELLRGIAEVQPVAALADAAATAQIDLCQGAFARPLPWQRWGRDWRWPLALLGGALLLQLAAAGLENWQLRERDVALRRQIEQTYRAVEPRGMLVEPERQLRRKVEALRGQGGGAVLPLLARVGEVLQGIEGVTLFSLSYSERQHELRLSLGAASFADVERLRQGIASRGLKAELVGSSADGDRTRAQLRISGQ